MRNKGSIFDSVLVLALIGILAGALGGLAVRSRDQPQFVYHIFFFYHLPLS